MVRALLDDITWKRDWQDRWHATPDLVVPGDYIVRLPDGPIVIIRPFSEEDPADLFNIRIVPGRDH